MWLSKTISKLNAEKVKVQDSLFKNINTILRIFIFLVLNMFEHLKDQRALKNTDKETMGGK